MSSGIPAINIDWGPKTNDKLVYIELSYLFKKENILVNPYLFIENGKSNSIFLKHILLGFDDSNEKLIRIDKTIPADSKEDIVVIDKEDRTPLQLPNSNPSSIKLTLNISPFHNQPILVIPLAKANLVQND
jgi:hypothetical protein